MVEDKSHGSWFAKSVRITAFVEVTPSMDDLTSWWNQIAEGNRNQRAAGRGSGE